MLQGCGGGTDVRIEDSSPPLPVPQDGLTGIALKGAIRGGALSVTDAAGAALELRESTVTGADGRYRLTFSEAAVSGGISAPLTLQIAGGEGVTARCDVDLNDVANPGNDCEIDDDEFVAFGDAFPIPETFTLRGTIAALPAVDAPIYTLNLSPATDLANALAEATADGSALTTDDIALANTRVITLLALLTGLALPDADLTQVAIFDITANDGRQAELLPAVLVAYASAVLSELDPGDTDVDTLPEVIERIRGEFDVDSQDRFIANGATLSRLSQSMATGLQTLNTRLAAAGATNDSLVAAQAFAESRAGDYALLADEDIDIATGDVAADGVPRTRLFARALHLATQLPSGDYTDGTVTLRMQQDGTGSFEMILGGQLTETGRLTADGTALFADGTAEALALPPR